MPLSRFENYQLICEAATKDLAQFQLSATGVVIARDAVVPVCGQLCGNLG